MTKSKIVADDISSWNSLEDIAETLEKRGLERLDVEESSENEIIMEVSDDEFIAIIKTEEGKSESDYRKRMSSTRHTQLVSTNDFEEFTFVTRIRSWDKHGQIKFQKFSFEKKQFRGRGKKRTVLKKLNNIEYGKSRSIYEIYDTKRVVKEFYDKFEKIRAKMVQEVTGIPDDRGEAKQNYAQTIFDRLIFLYFLQEKNLLNYNKSYLKNKHEEIAGKGKNVYEEFYKPLFFEKLAKKEALDTKFGSLPYLDGGLFTRSDVEEKVPEARLGETKEETNSLFKEILDFLGDWNWYADERLDIVDPKNLSPEVLGHIFEKTVNQKEMGAYYTPEEITHFMARNTIQPYILDRINEEFDKDYDEIDSIFKIKEDQQAKEGEDIQIGPFEDISKEEIEFLYFDVLKEIKVLDPAVGSGAFLLAAQEILLDVYLSCIEYFKQLEDKESWKMSDRVAELLENIEEEKNVMMFVKKGIILNNLYGVDIDKGATEICKLRLWLSMVANMEEGDDPSDIDPLPNIDFNIRQGNSLIGFTETLEKALDDDVDDGNAQANLQHYEPDAIHKKYNEIIQEIKVYKNPENSEEKRKEARKKAKELLEEYREDPDKKILKQFHEAGIENADMEDIKEFSPFHWILEFAEVYSEGGFDVIIGNPPWEEVKLTREDFFSDYFPAFRQLNKDKKDKKEEELLEDDEIRRDHEERKSRRKNLANYYTKSDIYQLQSSKVNGKTVSGDTDLAPLFTERILELTKKEGYTSFILPKVIFSSGSKKSLRKKLLNDTKISHVLNFENNGIFEDLHYQKKFSIITYKKWGNTSSLKTLYSRGNTDVLRDLDLAIDTSREILENYSPRAISFPTIRSKLHMETLETLISFPEMGEEIDGVWNPKLYRELDKTKNRDRFMLEEDQADYPVVGGKVIHQFAYNEPFADSPNLWSIKEEENKEKSAKARIRSKNYNKLKSVLVRQLGWGDSKKSQIKFLNDILKKKRGRPYSREDVLLDSTQHRIGFRKVTNATNERTMIASLIPKGAATVDPITTIRPYKINADKDDLEDYPMHGVYEREFTDKELLAAIAIMNSIPFDYLLRPKVEENISNYKMLETQAPRLTQEDNWFDFVSKRAAKLVLYDDDFEDIRNSVSVEPITDPKKRKKLRTEIDAALLHAYNLKRSEVKFLLEDFDTIENPRMMTEDYFDMVLEKYEELAEKGPMD